MVDEVKKVHGLYLSVAPNFAIRSANRQDIMLAKEVDQRGDLEGGKTVVKGGHIPNNCYVNTGFGDVFKIFRDKNILYAHSISTKLGNSSPTRITEPGLWFLDHEKTVLLREWGGRQ